MARRSTAGRCSGVRSIRGYLVAIGLAGAAILCRVGLQPIAPGTAPYVLTLPAIVAADILYGTWPAAVAAISAAMATYVLVLDPSWHAHPPSLTALLDTALWMASCGLVLWVTHRLRSATASAALAEARLAEVFRQVPAAAAILNAPDGRLLLNSRLSNDILGHPPLAAIDVYGGVHADGTRFAPDAYPIVRALRSGEVVGGEHMRYRRPDGRVVDLDVHAGPVRSADGSIVAAVGMAFDVTERMAAERQVRESEAKFRALSERLRQSEAEYRTVAERLRATIDAGGFGVWEIDLPTGEIRMDAAMAEIFGMPPEAASLPQTDMRAFIHPADRDAARAKMQAAIATGGIYAEECRIVTPQGDVRWIVSRGAIIPDIRKVVGVARDVTQRREREDALRAALEARDMLIREADHRIKNSLQLVASMLSIQLSKADDGAIKEALGGAIARVQAIAAAHLALQRSSDLQVIDIDPMLSELCQRVGTLNPSVEVRFNGQSHASLDAEKAIPLGLITSELLTNALRHAFAPGEPGQASLTVGADEQGLSLVVADHGKGLPSGARRSGLGSSVIAALAKQIGASVATESAPGQGTAVTIRLAPEAAAARPPLKPGPN
jgi:PAS domain S-box-containing protein